MKEGQQRPGAKNEKSRNLSKGKGNRGFKGKGEGQGLGGGTQGDGTEG